MLRDARVIAPPVATPPTSVAPTRPIAAAGRAPRSTRARLLLLSVPGLVLAATSGAVPAADEDGLFLERCTARFIDGGDDPEARIERFCGCMLEVSASAMTPDEREMLLLSMASPMDMARMASLGEDVGESMSEKLEAGCT